MSQFIVEVCQIDEVTKHQNADRMAVAKIKGWQTLVKRDENTGVTDFNPGDKCVFFPPDTIMPKALAERFGIVSFLKSIPKYPGQSEYSHYRVAGIRIRGEVSDGFVAHPDDPNWPVGLDVTSHYGVTKWDPPEDCTDGDVDKAFAHFVTYDGPEAFGNFPHVIKIGELVAISEKIDGQQCRNGYMAIPDESGVKQYGFIAGSHEKRRKKLDSNGLLSNFWKPLEDERLGALLKHLSNDLRDVIVFDEIYGPHNLKRMPYGVPIGQQDYRVYDIMVAGRYLDHEEKVAVCKQFDVPMVPYLYVGPFEWNLVEKLTYGPNGVCAPEVAGPFKMREGIVITPLKERTDPKIRRGTGRVILKSVSTDFRNYSKGHKDSH